MADGYLGLSDTTGSFDRTIYNGYGYCNNNDIYACPGSGSMEITECAAYVRNTGATAIHFRIAVYDANPTDAGSRLWYSAEITLPASQSVYSWVGLTGLSGTNLTGGTNYTVFIVGDNDNFRCAGIDDVNLNDAAYPEVSYGVPPESFALGDLADYRFCVRVGVTAAGGGGKATKNTRSFPRGTNLGAFRGMGGKR